MRLICFPLFLVGLTLSATANYSLQIGNVTWAGGPGGYNCFSTTEYPNTVTFTITKTTSGTRTYAVTAGPSATTGNYNRQLRSGANRLNYQLYTTSARNYALKAPVSAQASEVIGGTSNAKVGTVFPLSFVFHVSPNQMVPPGTYTDQVTVSIYRRYNDTAAPRDTRTVTLTVVVVPAAILSLVPTGSGFSGTTSHNLHFENLARNQSLGCDLLVRKNTGCTITFSSFNRGVMKAIPTPTADSIPYDCTVNSILLNLANAAQISLPTGVSPSQDGNRLPINVTIGDPTDAAAGNYQDQIVITLLAQ